MSGVFPQLGSIVFVIGLVGLVIAWVIRYISNCTTTCTSTPAISKTSWALTFWICAAYSFTVAAGRQVSPRFATVTSQSKQGDQGTKCAKLRKRSKKRSEREFGQAGRLDYVNFGTYVPRI